MHMRLILWDDNFHAFFVHIYIYIVHPTINNANKIKTIIKPKTLKLEKKMYNIEHRA